MASNSDDSGTSTGRSPPYPFVPLHKAVARADQFWRLAGHSSLDVATARQAWGYGPDSSGFVQTEAALKQFGLLDIEGRGKGRRLKLSPLAVHLVGDQNRSPEERQKWSEQAARNPKIHAELWERWRDDLPDARVVSCFLIQERGFNPKGANDLIAEYKKTLGYIRLVSTLMPGDGMQGDPGEKSEKLNPSLIAHEGGSAIVPPATRPNEINVSVSGGYLSVAALVDRQGFKKLMNNLAANGVLLEE